MKTKGFTLIELLIAIGLLGILAVTLLVALDPLEQIRRSQDVKMISASKEIYDSLFRYNVNTGQVPYVAAISGASLSSTEPQDMIAKLIKNEDLKNDFNQRTGDMLPELYFTGNADLSQVAFCFIPKSKSYKRSGDTIYDKLGNIINCSQGSCHLCFGVKSSLQEAIQSQITPSEQFPYCEGFDSEKPQYPWTCNNSSKWSKYGCSNYCVGDFGCDSFCPVGQRHLKKNYYAIGSPDFEKCSSRTGETGEDYCISGTAAHCSEMSYPSSTSDFLWGCLNPRRSYAWK